MPFSVSGSSSPNFYPIGLNLSLQTVLVVGGGNVAARKLKRLVHTGCHLTLLTREILLPCQALVNDYPEITVIRKAYDSTDLPRIMPRLVFACTDAKKVNAKIVADAHDLKIWTNCATDSLAQSDFIVPSVIAFDTLQIAFLSSGNSPMLIKQLREQFEAELSGWVAPYVATLGLARTAIKNSIADEATRHRLLTELTGDEALLAACRTPDTPQPDLLAQNWLQQNGLIA